MAFCMFKKQPKTSFFAVLPLLLVAGGIAFNSLAEQLPRPSSPLNANPLNTHRLVLPGAHSAKLMRSSTTVRPQPPNFLAAFKSDRRGHGVFLPSPIRWLSPHSEPSTPPAR